MEQQSIRAKVNESLFTKHQDELVKIVFHQDDINRLVKWEHSREFEYKDQMYDVVKQFRLKDSLVFWCFPDFEESNIKKKIKFLMALALSEDGSNSENRIFIEHFFQNLISPTRSQYPLRSLSFSSHNIPVYNTFWTSLSIPPIVPPPKGYS